MDESIKVLDKWTNISTAYNNFATHSNVNNYHRPITSHHFSHMHVTFWLGIEQCSNWRQNLVPEESGPRFARHVPEIGVRISIYVACFWNMCRGPYSGNTLTGSCVLLKRC